MALHTSQGVEVRIIARSELEGVVLVQAVPNWEWVRWKQWSELRAPGGAVEIEQASLSVDLLRPAAKEHPGARPLAHKRGDAKDV